MPKIMLIYQAVAQVDLYGIKMIMNAVTHKLAVCCFSCRSRAVVANA